jgi:hypothetical protein
LLKLRKGGLGAGQIAGIKRLAQVGERLFELGQGSGALPRLE